MNKLKLKLGFIISLTFLSTSHTIAGTSLNTYDLNEPVGWGTVDGSIIGSSDKNTITVTTASELISAMSGTAQKTIFVKGTLTFTGQEEIKSAQNKTVYGLSGSSLCNTTHTSTVDNTGILMLKNCKNIILRNLTFKGAGAYDIDGNDNLTVQNSTYIWVDHCDFQDGVDGNFDCNNGSNYISVTWCRFRYLIDPWSGGSGGADDHRYTDLWGGSDKNNSVDGGKLNTTFANCWWDEGCKERMPRVRFGKIHIVNCLYSSSVANYCAGGGYRSNLYIENNAYTSTAAKKYPWKNYATESGYTDYNVTLTNCLGANDIKKCSGSQTYFNPYDYYKYTPYAASSVESVVTSSNGAGATLTISEGVGIGIGLTAAIEAVEESSSSENITNTEYFSIDGKKLSEPQKGINITRINYSNGKNKIIKEVIK